MRRGRMRAEVLRRLDAEWAMFAADPTSRTRCRAWACEAPVLQGCDSLDAVLGRVAADPDAVLGRLLRWSAAGDPLAGRVVLQALVPKVVLMAARDPTAGVDDYLTALWFRIAAYPLDRRPTSIAANLALDTLKAVRRDRRPDDDVTTAPDLVVRTADRRPGHVIGTRTRRAGPTAVVVLERAREHRLVDPATSELLASVYADGLSGTAAAERHGLSPGAVRSRCSRAVRLLARHAALLGDPA